MRNLPAFIRAATANPIDALERRCRRVVTTSPRFAVLTFLLVGVLATIVAVTGLSIDTSVEGLMLEGDPDRRVTTALREEFSNDEIVVVAFDLGHVFTIADLRVLRDVSAKLAEIDGVDEVLELTTIEDIRGESDVLHASPFIGEDLAAIDIESIRRRARGHRLYQGNFISADLDVLAAIIVLEPDVAPKQRTRAAVERILATLAEQELPWPYHTGGYALAEREVDRVIRHDLARLGPVALAIALGIVALSTRRLFTVGLMLILITWSTAMSMAWLAVSGARVTMVTSAVPAILIATSSTYGIYLLGALAEVSRKRCPADELVRVLVSPVLLSSCSTAIGFVSLRLMGVRTITDLGMALAVGNVAAAAAALILLPSIIQVFDLRLPVLRVLSLGEWSVTGVRLAQRPIAVLTIACVVVVATIPGIRMIRVENDPMTYFPPETSFRHSVEFIRERVSGADVVNIVVRARGADAILHPAAMQHADALLEKVEGLGSVNRTVSFLDYVYLMDAAMLPGQSPRTVLPTRELAAQYMLLYESGGDPRDYRHYINFDRSALNLLVRVTDGSTGNVLSLRDAVADYAPQAENLEIRMAGSLYLLTKAMETISRSLAAGLLVALGLILVVMAVVLRSARLAMIALVPNALPILTCGALLGYSGIPLSIGTSVVGCIALGLAVDDTAHVLGHLRAGYPLAAVYRLVARPMLLTTLCLGLGFSALMLSGFEPIWALGAATSVTLGVAFLCDWLVLPSMLRILDVPLFADAESEDAAQGHGGAPEGLPGFSGLEANAEVAGRPQRGARHAA